MKILSWPQVLDEIVAQSNFTYQIFLYTIRVRHHQHHNRALCQKIPAQASFSLTHIVSLTWKSWESA